MMWKVLLLCVLAHAAIFQVQAGDKLKTLAVYPLNKDHGGEDMLGQAGDAKIGNVAYSTGPNGEKNGATFFKGMPNSYIQFPNKGDLEARESLTMCAWIKHQGKAGPIFNYGVKSWGCHLWMTNKQELFVRFTHDQGKNKKIFTEPIKYNSIQYDKWQFVCASYNGKTGKAKLFANSRYVASRDLKKNLRLSTDDDARMGARVGDGRYFKGSISCMQVYASALSAQQLIIAKNRCFHTEVEHQLKCKANYMEVSIKKPTQFTLASDLHLMDPACVPKDTGKGFYIKFGLDKCGTTVRTTKTHLIYTNKVIGRKENLKHIGRVKDIVIKLQCAYRRKEALLSNQVEPNQDKFRGASKEEGKFSFTIKLYPNETYDEPYVGYPVQRYLRQRIFVEVSVDNTGNPLAILAKNCYATATKLDKPPRHPLIQKSCPADRTLKLLKSSGPNIQRFSFETFKFKNNQKYFYIRCHVVACDANNKGSVCAKGCQKKEKRELQVNHEDEVIDRSLEENLDEAVSMAVQVSE